MRREYWQSHDSSGFRAKVTVELETPRDAPELPPERMARAEEIAEDVMEKLAPKPLEIVQAMMGRSSAGEKR
jgi:hypothetical protein